MWRHGFHQFFYVIGLSFSQLVSSCGHISMAAALPAGIDIKLVWLPYTTVLRHVRLTYFPKVPEHSKQGCFERWAGYGPLDNYQLFIKQTSNPK